MNNFTTIFKYAVVLTICILAFLAWKGCQNGKAVKHAAESMKEQNDMLDELFKERDKWRQDSLDFVLKVSTIDGNLDLTHNQLISTSDSLMKAKGRIATLLSKHKSIEPSKDSSSMVVPTEFVADCKDCFTELKSGQDLVIKYKGEKEQQEQLFLSKINVLNNRVGELTTLNNSLKGTLTDAVAVAKDVQKKLEPRRTMYLTMGTLSFNRVFPNSIGAGFLYKDKRDRMFGLEYYNGEYKSIYHAQLAFPLSFKRK